MKKKVCILIAVLIVFLIPAVMVNMRQGVRLGGTAYALRGSRQDMLLYGGFGGSAELRRTGQGAEGVIRHGNREYGVRLEWSGENARIEFDDGEVIEGRWIGGELVDGEGIPLWFSEDRVTIFVEGETEPEISRYALARALCLMERGQTEPFGYLGLVAVGAAVYGFGMLAFLYPEKVALLGSRWRYDYVELSDAGRMAETIGGVAAMAARIFTMVLTVFIE